MAVIFPEKPTLSKPSARISEERVLLEAAKAAVVVARRPRLPNKPDMEGSRKLRTRIPLDSSKSLTIKRTLGYLS